MNVTQNQTMCGCDGGLTISSDGGTPPYTYSIDGGMTYKTIPVFSNLCSGSYNIIVTDNNGILTSKTIILNPPSKPTTYSVSLNTTSELVENSNTSIGKKYTTTLNISPSLPDNVSLTFDIGHLNTSKSSPQFDSSISESSSELLINGEGVKSIFSEDSSETPSTIPGCQSNKVYINSKTEKWEQITITNTDTMVLNTRTVVIKNESVNCYIGTSDEKYSLSNLHTLELKLPALLFVKFNRIFLYSSFSLASFFSINRCLRSSSNSYSSSSVESFIFNLSSVSYRFGFVSKRSLDC
jgi:hypothetical protein